MFSFMIIERPGRLPTVNSASYSMPDWGDHTVPQFVGNPPLYSVLVDVLNGCINDAFLSDSDNNAIAAARIDIKCIFAIPGKHNALSRVHLLQQFGRCVYNGVIKECPSDSTHDYLVSGDFIGAFTKAVQSQKPIASSGRWCIFKTLADFLAYAICSAVENSKHIKLCGNCGRYFIATQANAKYCTGTAPQNGNMTCQQYGAYLNYTDNKPEYKTLHKQIYSTLSMRAKRTGRAADKQAATDYYNHYTKLKAKLASGKIAADDIAAWLTEYKSNILNNAE